MPKKLENIFENFFEQIHEIMPDNEIKNICDDYKKANENFEKFANFLNDLVTKELEVNRKNITIRNEQMFNDIVCILNNECPTASMQLCLINALISDLIEYKYSFLDKMYERFEK